MSRAGRCEATGGTEAGRRSRRRTPAALLDQALTLIARSQCGEPERERGAQADLLAWRGESAAHEAAALQAGARWQAAGGLAAHLRDAGAAPQNDDDTALARTALNLRRRGNRLRQLAAGVGTAAVLLLAVLVGRWAWLLPTFEHGYAASRGQQVHGVALPDGTRLDLDADTRLGVVYTRQQRETTLAHGQARFDVVHEPDRVFTVHTRHGSVRVLGTAFTVSDRGGAVHVVVERGRVRVEAGEQHVDLGPDQGVRIKAGPDGADPPRLGPTEATAGVDASAWRTGWLVFDGVPLAEALAQFNAYLPQPIEVAPDAAGLRLTGNFRANNPQAFLRALGQALPVKVRWLDAGTAARRAVIEAR